MKKLLSCFCLLVLFMTGCTKNPSKSSEDSLVTSSPSLQIDYLFEDNDWRYYDSVKDKNICRVKINGEEYSVILNYKSLQEYDEQPITGLWVIDELLFFRMTFELYRYDLQTQTLTEIDGDARQVGFLGKDVYFSGREATIYRMNIHDNEPTALLKSEMNGDNKEKWKNLYKNFIFVDGVMYYYKRNPDGLYRYQNGESTLIDNNPAINEFSLFEHDNKLYYVVLRDELSKLTQYNPKDGKISELATCSDYSSGSTIKDGYFYYLDSEGKEKQTKIISTN